MRIQSASQGPHGGIIVDGDVTPRTRRFPVVKSAVERVLQHGEPAGVVAQLDQQALHQLRAHARARYAQRFLDRIPDLLAR
jgi:hypothetical protein